MLDRDGLDGLIATFLPVLATPIARSICSIFVARVGRGAAQHTQRTQRAQRGADGARGRP